MHISLDTGGGSGVTDRPGFGHSFVLWQSSNNEWAYVSLSTVTTFPVHKKGKKTKTNLAFSFQLFVFLKKSLHMHHTVSNVCKVCLLCQQVVQGKLNLQDTLEQSRSKPMSTYLEVGVCCTLRKFKSPKRIQDQWLYSSLAFR